MTAPLSAARQSENARPSPEAEAEIERLGITRVLVDYFHWREFRYTNQNDAIAQAKRAQAKESVNKSSSTNSPKVNDELTPFGITRIPVDYFCYREFRYTNVKDAVGQAKREVEPDRSDLH